ncbi:CRISPR-associated protein Cas4 (plasmid) [Halobiforma lacisalsi AJ5]|uniref:CRISPR-associated exonuclease Cas4 n=1 Tax=Natronobacterium lacisalsi AJ5 TaxID=358396 RepID=M0L9B4_NATLA|nr:CRISPR-associated protein Cas4 [Halobiforma lacisalsi]APX00234.1 CRISPR-associated protein Cas4 [Halobiforma lacisalsi AJ5]EMA30166.1 CRISPR-associated protein Cas4 [Halobiforma lacisalsi AJ5]
MTSELAEKYARDERQPEREPEVRITGLMVQYYHVCKRELWFMSRGIDIDRETTNIQRGTHIDETSYQNERHSFMINNRIQLDVLGSGDIMEVKASSRLEEPARMQLLFYLWFLQEIYGIEKDGILAYPTERKRETITLNSSTIEKVESTITGILKVVDLDTPPELEKKAYCDSCLYQDICWM